MRTFAKLSKTFLISVLIVLGSQVVFAGELQQYGAVSDFKLKDQNGKEIGLSDFKNQVWIANFIFTRCQGMCPLISGQAGELQKKLSDSGVKLVSFSVDPEHDTVSVLRKYAARFGAKEGIWHFLTGDKKTIWDLAEEGFKLGVMEPTEEDLKNGAEPVMHSSRFALVDRSGMIRGYYDSTEPEEMTQLVKDALSL